MGWENLACTLINYENNPMNMVWHDDKCAYFNIWEMDGDFIPPPLNNFTISI